MEEDLTDMLLTARFEMIPELMGDARQLAQVDIDESGMPKIKKLTWVRQATQAELEEDQLRVARIRGMQQRFS